jgi:hypothetical protein
MTRSCRKKKKKIKGDEYKKYTKIHIVLPVKITVVEQLKAYYRLNEIIHTLDKYLMELYYLGAVVLIVKGINTLYFLCFNFFFKNKALQQRVEAERDHFSSFEIRQN